MRKAPLLFLRIKFLCLPQTDQQYPGVTIFCQINAPGTEAENESLSVSDPNDIDSDCVNVGIPQHYVMKIWLLRSVQ